ncbi:MAG TPA: hypothetical protein DDW23_06430 [Planctomycetes bacterium]|nr:hypothetical protein [Planctomycetota bacterium]
MDIVAFRESVKTGDLLEEIGLELQSLYMDGQGNWEAAHGLIDHCRDPESSRVHAYLHRKEGDMANADFWYDRAGESRPDISLEEEWEELVERFLLREA